MKRISSIILFCLTILLTTSCEEDVQLIKVHTEYGDMLVYLYDSTPQHKANFIKLTKEGYFDGTTFHRTIRNFVIQGGDPNSKDSNPNNDGEGGPNYTIPAEFKAGIKHKYGAVGAARDNNPQMASNGSQFYIVVNKKGTPNLDGKYTVFGEVVEGMDVAEKIAQQPTDPMNNRPLKNIPMTVTIVKMKLSKLTKEMKEKAEQLQSR